LTELLVVVAIVGVLVALLLPVIGKVRNMATNVVCTGRLKDLALASQSYHTQYGGYPVQSDPPAAGLLGLPINLPILPGGLLPLDSVDSILLNDLRSYMAFPAVGPGTSAVDLPPVVQCPTVQNIVENRDWLLPLPLNLGGPRTRYYTGYVYTGRAHERTRASSGGGGLPLPLPLPPPLPGTPVSITLLKPERIAGAPKGLAEAVVWADDLHWSLVAGGAGSPGWGYAHANGRQTPGPTALTYLDTAGLAGQHRAYADGHVEWVPGEHLRPGLDSTNVPAFDGSATVKVGPGYYSWF
jgi:type II secretory pathway pseudopilin PulG